MVRWTDSTFFFLSQKNILMHFVLKRHFLRELDHSMSNPFGLFVINFNKFLVVQVNDSCIPFISHNSYIFFLNDSCIPFITHNSYIFFLSIFHVGLVSEMKKNFNLGTFKCKN